MTVVLGLLTMMQSRAQSEIGTLMLMPKVGAAWTTMAADGIYYGVESNEEASAKGKFGFVGGVEAEYQLLDKLSLSAGVLYARQGTAYEDVPKTWKDYKVSLDYLDIPILAHLYVAPNLAVQLGVQPGFLIHQRQSGEAFLYKNDGAELGWQSFSENTTYHRTFDFGIPIGISYDFDSWRIECRYCLGLYDATKYKLKERNRSLQLTVGYRFTLWQ